VINAEMICLEVVLDLRPLVSVTKSFDSWANFLKDKSVEGGTLCPFTPLKQTNSGVFE
jgi:hypothetical protein